MTTSIHLGLGLQPRIVHNRGEMFYNTMIQQDVPAGTTKMLLSSNSEGTGPISVDDSLQIVFNAHGDEAGKIKSAKISINFAPNNPGWVATVDPVDILNAQIGQNIPGTTPGHYATVVSKSGDFNDFVGLPPGDVRIKTKFRDEYGGSQSCSDIFLMFSS